MPSIKAKVLNLILKSLVKPFIYYYSKKYLKTKDIKIIQWLRKIVNHIHFFIPAYANVKHFTLNEVPAVQISATPTIPTTTIFYLHGGAYIVGSPQSYLGLAYRLAAACFANVILIDYRLAPEHPFPAALNDALNAYQALCAREKNLDKLFIAGDSSGGGLALSLLVVLKEKQLPLPKAAVCISPWTDLAMTGESLHYNKLNDSLLSLPFCQLYATNDDIYNPHASPLYADLSGFPPLLIQVSDKELLLEDSTRLAEKAVNAGVKVDIEIWENLPHVWHLFAKFLPEGVQAIEKIGIFIEKSLKKS